MEEKTKKILTQSLAQFAVLYGYTLPNAAFYAEGGLLFFKYFIEMLQGDITDSASPEIEEFFQDEIHITAFVVVVTYTFLLSVSNQKRYADMVMELWNKPTSTETKTSLQTFLETLADIMGTHMKTMVTSAAFKRMLDRIIGPEYSLIIALFMVPFGELAQFSILGRAHGFGLFKNAFASFFESTLLAGITFAITHALDPNSAVFAALISWNALLLAQAAIISATHKSALHNLYNALTTMIACHKPLSHDKENSPLLQPEENQTGASSWWQSCSSFWSSPVPASDTERSQASEESRMEEKAVKNCLII